MPGLDDYGALIRSGQAAIPDFAAEAAQRQALDLQLKFAALQIAAAKQKQDRAAQFQTDITSFDGSPSGVSKLMMKYPEFADHLKQSWDVHDKAQQKVDLTQLGEIYSAASSGNWELAKTLAHKRADAERAAGNADATYEEALKVMDGAAGGDKDQQRMVLNLVGTQIAAATGPEHFGTVYGNLKGGYTLDAGAARFDDQGNMVAHSPFIKGDDGALYDYNSVVGGGGPASTGAGGPSPSHAPAAVVSRSHGYTPRQRDGGDNPDNVVDNKIAALSKAVGVDPDTPMNPDQFASFVRALPATEGASGNNPGGIKDGAYAKAQPGYAGANGQYAVFQSADAGMAAMQKLLTNRYYNRGQQSIRDIIEGRPTGQAQASASTGAGPRVLLPGKTPSKRLLTDAEATARGLPTTQKYQIDDKTGDVSPVAGTSTGSDIDPDALNAEATNFILTGKMSALGMGNGGIRTQILNQRAKLMKQYGVNPNQLTSIQTEYAADSKAYGQRTQQLSYMNQAMDATTLHADGVRGLIRNVPAQTNSRFLNWITQGVEGQFSNSTIAQLQGAIPLLEGEVARVMTGNPSSGAGQLTDAARGEFSILRSAVGPDAKIAALDRIVHMMHQKIDGVQKDADRLQSRMEGGLATYAGKSGAPSSSDPVRVRSVQEARALAPGTLYLAPDGKVRRR